MFDAKILSSSLKEIVDALKLVNESYIILSASEAGMRTRFIDPANVFMADAKIPDNAFSTYPEIDGLELQITLELSRLSNFVDSVDDNGQNAEDIRLEYDDVAYTLRLTSDNMSTLQQQVAPDLVRRSPNNINCDWLGTAKINASDFVRAIKAMYKLEIPEGVDGIEYVRMGLKPNHTMGKEGTFYMEAVFEKTKKPYDPLRFVKTNSDNEPISTSKEVESMLSIDYIDKMGEIIKETKTIEITLGQDLPGKYRVILPKSSTEIEYIQAPRVVEGN